MPEVTPKRKAPPSFAHQLATLEGGKLNADLSRDAAALIREIREVSAARGNGPVKGELTIKVDIKVEGALLEIGAKISTKAPKLPRRRTMRWTDTDGNILDYDPEQGELGLTVVDEAEQAPARVV